MFAVHGAAQGSYAARIPWIQERLDLSPGALGLGLLMMSAGGIAAMPFSGRIVHRYGSQATTRWVLPAWALAIVLPAMAPNLPLLCIAMASCGITAGISDVAMNAQGVAVERRAGRPIMSGLHGMWSVGGLVGSAGGALAAHAGVDARVQLATAGGVLATVVLVAARGLLTDPAAAASAEPPRFALPTGPVLAIGLIGFCAIVVEGSSADWCAVYLRQVTEASPGVAAASYTVFALMMAVGRLTGDAVVRRFGAVPTVRASGGLAVAGGVLVVAAGTPAVAIGGFALLGIGIAVVVPLAFAAAGHASAHPANAIAGVATIAYGAGLGAPGVIGGVANLTSLPVSFALVTAAAVLIALGAGRLRPADLARESATTHLGS